MGSHVVILLQFSGGSVVWQNINESDEMHDVEDWSGELVALEISLADGGVAVFCTSWAADYVVSGLVDALSISSFMLCVVATVVVVDRVPLWLKTPICDGVCRVPETLKEGNQHAVFAAEVMPYHDLGGVFSTH